MATSVDRTVPITSLIEDDLISRIKAACGSMLRMCESLPGEWDDDFLKRLVTKTPGVYVAFTGGQTNAPGQTLPQIESEWTLYAATGHAQGQDARRRGDPQQVGAYALWEILARTIHGRVIAGQGTADFQRLENLYTGAVDSKGVAVYAVVFRIPFTLDSDPTALLTPFAQLNAMWDVPPETPADHTKWLARDTSTTAPDAQDTVILPQP